MRRLFRPSIKRDMDTGEYTYRGEHFDSPAEAAAAKAEYEEGVDAEEERRADEARDERAVREVEYERQKG